MEIKLERYSRQIRYKNIGEEGQKKLLASRVAVVGMGALGSVIANELVRAGVGFLRLIDRDLVEISNLQRQVLYTEQDAETSLPKVTAAAAHLAEANSEVQIEPIFGDLNSGNIETLLGDVDLVVDGTDNMETRELINEYCVENQIPWIYGGAIESEGMTASFLPGGPCLACFSGTGTAEGSSGTVTCSSVGVLNSVTAIVASLEATEAIKILAGADTVRRDILFLELWENEFETIPLEKNPSCPVCGSHHYRYLGHASGTRAIPLCGKDGFQIIPSVKKRQDFEDLKQKLSPLGTVTVSPFSLDFCAAEANFKVFRDGRAIIRNVRSEGQAKSIYTEYIGE